MNEKHAAPPVGSAKYCPAGSSTFTEWQADVIWFGLLKSKNKQNKAILTILNTTSRLAFAKALKDNKSSGVSVKMKKILDEIAKKKLKITVLRVIFFIIFFFLCECFKI